MWSRSQSVSNIVSCLIIALGVPCLAQVTPPVTPIEKGLLRAGDIIESPIAPAEVHQYLVKMKRGDVLVATAAQERVDMMLAVHDGSEAELLRINSIQPGGDEEIRVKADVDGPLYLRVIARRPKVSGGRYTLRLNVRSPSSGSDDQYIEALRLFMAGKSRGGRPNDADQLVQLDRARAVFRSLGDMRMVAATLTSAGEIARFLDRFDESAALANQAIRIFEELNLPAGKAEALCVLGVAYGITGKLDDSAKAFEEAAAIDASLGAVEAEMTATTNLGVTFMQMGKHDAARKHLDRAIALDREVGDEEGLAISLANLGNVQVNLGQSEAAVLTLQEAVDMARRLELPYYEGGSLSTLCHANYKLSRFEVARAQCEQALAINRKIKEQNGEAISLFYLSAIEYDTGRYREAAALQEQTLEVYKALGNKPAMVMAMIGLAETYHALGQLEQAMSTNASAVAMAKESRLGTLQAGAMSRMGIYYTAVGQYDRALDSYEQALSLQREAKERASESETLHKISELCLLTGQIERAVEYGKQALAASRETGELRAQASSWSALGRAQLALGNAGEALASFERSYKLRAETGARATAGEVRQYIAKALSALGRYQGAAAAFEESIATADSVGNVLGSASALADWAGMELERGRLNEARNLIARSLRQYEATRAAIYNPSTRATYFSSAHDANQIEVEVLMRLHRQSPRGGLAAKAFEAAERARARSLLELLTERAGAVREGVDPSLLERERTLAQQMNATAKTLSEMPRETAENQEMAKRISRQLEDLRSRYEQTQTDLRRAGPRYAAATLPEPFTLAQIRGELDPDTLLLEYFLGPKNSILWVIGRESFSVYELPGEGELITLANRLYKAVTARAKSAPVAQADREVRDVSELLTRVLLAPAASELKDRRLAIVADGALQLVPFAMLPEPNGSEQPLVVNHEIVALPSASALAVQRRELLGRARPSKLAAVFADPVFSDRDERVRKNSQPSEPVLESETTRILQHLQAPSSGTSGIARLPFTRTEADQIVSLGGKNDVLAATGFGATRAAAVSAKLSDYRFLHFATHGLLDSERPEFSALVLSLVDEDGKPQDGYLRAYEIFNLNLRADLVVLSACQTGLGRDVKGEGIMGLTRGFLYAGASSVLVSLWSINDKATSDLITELYRAMIRGKLRPAAALRAAQVAVWKKKTWTAPYYWAALALQGYWR